VHIIGTDETGGIFFLSSSGSAFTGQALWSFPVQNYF
jgi:hypothetical protein